MLKLELTSRCNGFCVFCGHPGKVRKRSDIPLDEALRIIDEVAPFINEVQPQFYGEPTLYPHLKEVVDHCKKLGKRVVFYTNGSGRFNFDEHWPDMVIFSIDYYGVETCRAVRPGLKFDKVMANVLDYVNNPKRPVWAKTMVRGTLCEENNYDEEAIRRMWGGIVDNVRCYPEMPRCRGEYTGEVCEDYICQRTYSQMVITSDGDALLCCIDWHAETKGGNVADGVLEAWLCDSLESMRKRVLSMDWPEICKDCGFRARSAS